MAEQEGPDVAHRQELDLRVIDGHQNITYLNLATGAGSSIFNQRHHPGKWNDHQDSNFYGKIVIKTAISMAK